MYDLDVLEKVRSLLFGESTENPQLKVAIAKLKEKMELSQMFSNPPSSSNDVPVEELPVKESRPIEIEDDILKANIKSQVPSKALNKANEKIGIIIALGMAALAATGVALFVLNRRK